MEQRQGHLHFDFQGEYVLFHPLRLDSLPSFLVASLLTVVICIFERATSYALNTQWSPFSCTRARTYHALWRTSLFWLAMLLRLLYMLISMSFHAGIILVIVTSLSVGQFVIEIIDATPSTPSSNFDQAQEPLLLHPPSNESTAALRSITTSTRPRSKSKPSQIFIHPSQSNLARADAFALQRGLGGTTKYVDNVGYPGSAESWREGKGQEAARELLGHRKSSSSSQFQIGGDEDD